MTSIKPLARAIDYKDRLALGALQGLGRIRKTRGNKKLPHAASL